MGWVLCACVWMRKTVVLEGILVGHFVFWGWGSLLVVMCACVLISDQNPKRGYASVCTSILYLRVCVGGVCACLHLYFSRS